MILPVFVMMLCSGLAHKFNFDQGKYDHWLCSTNCYDMQDNFVEKEQEFHFGKDARVAQKTGNLRYKVMDPLRFELVTDRSVSWCNGPWSGAQTTNCVGEPGQDEWCDDNEQNCSQCGGKWCTNEDVVVHEVMMCWQRNRSIPNQLDDIMIECIGSKHGEALTMSMFWGSVEATNAENDGFLHMEYNHAGTEYCKSTCAPKYTTCAAETQVCEQFWWDQPEPDAAGVMERPIGEVSTGEAMFEDIANLGTNQGEHIGQDNENRKIFKSL